MNAIRQAHHAYKQDTHTIKTPRSSEYEAFVHITRKLKAVSCTQSDQCFAALAGAVHDNRRLWAILASDVSERQNPLPNDLKARIIYLAEFTRQHSQKVLSDGASTTPLVEINTAVMAGLREGGPVS